MADEMQKKSGDRPDWIGRNQTGRVNKEPAVNNAESDRRRRSTALQKQLKHQEKLDRAKTKSKKSLLSCLKPKQEEEEDDQERQHLKRCHGNAGRADTEIFSSYFPFFSLFFFLFCFEMVSIRQWIRFDFDLEMERSSFVFHSQSVSVLLDAHHFFFFFWRFRKWST